MPKSYPERKERESERTRKEMLAFALKGEGKGIYKTRKRGQGFWEEGGGGDQKGKGNDSKSHSRERTATIDSFSSRRGDGQRKYGQKASGTAG